jgi:hypothetical protein
MAEDEQPAGDGAALVFGVLEVDRRVVASEVTPLSHVSDCPCRHCRFVFTLFSTDMSNGHVQRLPSQRLPSNGFPPTAGATADHSNGQEDAAATDQLTQRFWLVQRWTNGKGDVKGVR